MSWGEKCFSCSSEDDGGAHKRARGAAFCLQYNCLMPVDNAITRQNDEYLPKHHERTCDGGRHEFKRQIVIIITILKLTKINRSTPNKNMLPNVWARVNVRQADIDSERETDGCHCRGNKFSSGDTWKALREFFEIWSACTTPRKNWISN